MSKIEQVIKDYSSRKLKEIVEQQSYAYSEDFIDYAKDELIKRGEGFQFDAELEKEIEVMSDNELKILVEKECNNYHLEYLEIARKEYLKRKFKNETSNEPLEEKKVGTNEVKYPALKKIAAIYGVSAWVIGIVGGIITISYFVYPQSVEMKYVILFIVFLVLIVLGLLALSESIKVVVDIESNTRKADE